MSRAFLLNRLPMIRRIFPLLSIALFATIGCEDEELKPIVQFDDLSIGAYPRLVNFEAGEYDLLNLDETAVRYTVEFVDGGDGSQVDAFRVYALFDDNDASNGDQSAGEILLRDVGPDDFSIGENGLPQYTIELSASEVGMAFGVNLDSLSPGDRVQIRTEVDKGEITFTDDNSTSAVTTAYGGIFNYNGAFTCPLEDDFLVGDYNFTYAGGDPDGGFGDIFGAEGTVTLELVPGSTTRRQYAASYIGGFDVTGVIDFVCDQAVGLSIDTGVGCGGGSIVLGQGASGGFDIDDENTGFSVEYVQFQEDGGCGAPRTPVTIQFTKA